MIIKRSFLLSSRQEMNIEPQEYRENFMKTIRSSKPTVNTNKYLREKNGRIKDKFSTMLRSQDSIENVEKLQLYLTQKNMPVESQFKQSKKDFVRKGRLAFGGRRKTEKKEKIQVSGLIEKKSEEIYRGLMKSNLSRRDRSKNVRRLRVLTQRGGSLKSERRRREKVVKPVTLKYLTNFVGSAYFRD